LLADNVAAKRGAVSRGLAALRAPRDLLRRARFLAQVLGTMSTGPTPRTSLNRRVRAGRRIGQLQLRVDDAKAVAHAHGGTINDLVLTLWTGGLRRLLQARHEPVEGVELADGIATTLRRSTTQADSVDNRVGTTMLRLPVWQADPGRRLEEIARRTSAARAAQLPAAVVAPLAVLAGTPLGRWYVARQRANNLISTNVIGSPVQLYLLGNRVLSMLPILDLQGNIGLSLGALSYAGDLVVAVTADARQFPDLDVLVDGMTRDLRLLASGRGLTLHTADETAG
jgi:hypothetical protein